MEAINVYDDAMKKKKEETTTVGEELVIDDLPSGDLNDAEPELDLSVSQLDGVGAVTQKKLETFGVTNLIDILMGDEVGPRKDFIISRALEVSNLDI